MSPRGQEPSADRDDPEPRVEQWSTAAHGGQVMTAGRNQYVLNLGNAAWVTAPAAVAIALLLVLYLAVGRAPRAAGSSSAGAAASLAGRSPVTVTLAYDQHDVDNGAGPCATWVFRRPLRAIAAPADGVLDETWARRLGGVDTRATSFKLAVQGATANAVQLLGFRAIDVSRGPAVSGTAIISSDGCGPSAEAGFEIALGASPPLIAPVSGLDSGAAKKIPFPFVVSSTDIQQFQVQAAYGLQPGAGGCGCEIRWRLALDWSYEGKTGTTVIDDDGKPFQTFYPSPSFAADFWWDDGGTWKRFS